MPKILLIEDDSGIVLPLKAYLEKEGYEVIHIVNGQEAVNAFQEQKFDLILLDINLPWISGIDVCKHIRWTSQVPIIVISARDSEADKLLLFEMWVDDYVAKPFSTRELLARIAAVIKRSEIQKKPKNSKTLELGPLVLSPKQFTATCDSEELILTKTEFSILEYCVKNAQNVIKREQIMQDVMGYDNYIYDRTIDTHIKNIRKKLDWKITIETIRGVGYKIYQN